MTRFTFSGDVTWGSGSNPRSVAIMTENQAGWDAYMGLAKHAIGDSRKLLVNTLSALDSKPSRTVVRYAHRYFLTGADRLDAKDLATIKSVILLTKNGMLGSNMAMKIAAEDPDYNGKVMYRLNADQSGPKESTKAYHNDVLDRGDGRTWRIGAVHVTGERLEMGRLGVKTLVHEATHKYAGTEDYCYFKDDGETPRSEFTSKKRALQNADSYAWFVLKIGRGSGMSNNMFSGS